MLLPWSSVLICGYVSRRRVTEITLKDMPSDQAVVAYAFNPSTQAGKPCELKASLNYRVRSWTARATERNLVLSHKKGVSAEGGNEEEQGQCPSKLGPI